MAVASSTGTPLLLAGLLEWPDLDGCAAGLGPLGRPRERGVQVGRGDDPEAAELLLGLRERPIGGDHLAVLGADDRGRLGRVEAAGEDPDPGGLDLGVERVDRLVPPLDLVLRGDRLPLDHVHRKQVLPHASSPFTWPGTAPAPHLCLRTPPAGIDTRPAPRAADRPQPGTPIRYETRRRVTRGGGARENAKEAPAAAGTSRWPGRTGKPAGRGVSGR